MAKNTGLEDPVIRELIYRQHGVVSAAQAASSGLPHETVRRRVACGLWQRPLPGVYALQSGPPNRRQWLIAAQLYAGEGSVLTGRAALSVYGLDVGRLSVGDIDGLDVGELGGLSVGEIDGPGVGHDPNGPELDGAADVGRAISTAGGARNWSAGRLDALVPHYTRRRNVVHLRITRTTRVPKPTRFGVLRVAPLARSVIDCCLAAAEDRDAAAIEGIVTAAIADGRVGLAELEYELAAAPRRHSGRVRAELARSRAHARAAASSSFLDELGASGPYGALQDVVVYAGHRRVARAAAIWPTRAVAVLLDAPEPEIRALTTMGFAVVRIAAERVEQDLAGALRQVGEVLMDRPEATMPGGLSLLPLASARPAETGIGRPAKAPRQRALTASSPARTGVSSVLPRGGTGHT